MLTAGAWAMVIVAGTVRCEVAAMVVLHERKRLKDCVGRPSGF